MRYPRSQALDARARQLMPGGHHLSGRPLLEGDRAPLYFDRAKGSRIWDVDGHEYIDYVLAYGAILLGYAHEEVDAAAVAQLRRGSLVSLNHPLHVTFLEALLRRFPGAEQAVFVKTGSEATTAALRIARRATGRRAVARCGYHGWHDWCIPLDAGVPAGLDEQVLEFSARDPQSLQALLSAHPGKLAAVIVAPEMILPLDGAVLADLIARTQRAGAVFILDEVKTAFRTAPGSVQQRFGLRPDLTTVSKALGNGWPIAAVLGGRELMGHADGLHLSATYHGDTASMAAAMATLDIVERDHVADQVARLGQRLIDGLAEGARRHDVPALAFGEPLPQMPFLRFTDPDPERAAAMCDAFYTEVYTRGVLLHPRHLWFVSAAHTNADIDRTLQACDAAFAIAARASS